MTLSNHVNNSGFPLQMALAEYVSSSAHGWSVLYEEEEWKSHESSGFIDLTIEDQHRTWLMNIECKRVRDSNWIFLRHMESGEFRRHSKLFVTRKNTADEIATFGWFDIPMDPSTHESNFCVVPGQDNRSRPMLERTAATLVESTEALAHRELSTLSHRYSDLRIYQNVIVTTANLSVCNIDVANINLETGELPDSTNFQDVPYLRFRKQLGFGNPIEQAAVDSTILRRFISNRESTVFVVSARHFGEFLTACELPDNIMQFIR